MDTLINNSRKNPVAECLKSAGLFGGAFCVIMGPMALVELAIPDENIEGLKQAGLQATPVASNALLVSTSSGVYNHYCGGTFLTDDPCKDPKGEFLGSLIYIVERANPNTKIESIFDNTSDPSVVSRKCPDLRMNFQNLKNNEFIFVVRNPNDPSTVDVSIRRE